MTQLPITYYGAPILRKKTNPVTQFDAALKSFIEDMHETLIASNGIGLAAPQVNSSQSIFIMQIPEEDAEGKMQDGPLIICINPKLSNPSADLWERGEGCLSIPGIYVPVVRPNSITLEAQDETGAHFKMELSGLAARCAMHENDHLNGVLMIDRVHPNVKAKIAPALQKLKNSRPSN